MERRNKMRCEEEGNRRKEEGSGGDRSARGEDKYSDYDGQYLQRKSRKS